MEPINSPSPARASSSTRAQPHSRPLSPAMPEPAPHSTAPESANEPNLLRSSLLCPCQAQLALIRIPCPLPPVISAPPPAIKMPPRRPSTPSLFGAT
ncbi:hypothetical protein M0R45_008874 [Rubus argutus]|uniref:Uncharacterized protein n=1 Tax=Rubus argutus TaxID=59490 RepID=A0AAW1Y5C5_RUBAR